MNIPRLQTRLIDRSQSFNPQSLSRSPSILQDTVEIDHLQSLRSASNVPRSAFYRGSTASRFPLFVTPVSQSSMDESPPQDHE